MTTKEKLKNRRKLNAEIHQLTDIKSKSGNDRYQRSIARQAKQKQNELNKILKAISEVTDPTYRTILYRKYVNEKSLSEISKELNFSLRWTCELLRRAEKEIKL